MEENIKQALRCLAQMTMYAPSYAVTVQPFADAHQESCRVLDRLQKDGVDEAGKGDWRELIPQNHETDELLNRIDRLADELVKLRGKDSPEFQRAVEKLDQLAAINR